MSVGEANCVRLVIEEVINSDHAREVILRSIRTHLAASVPHDAIYAQTKAESHNLHPNGEEVRTITDAVLSKDELVELFSESLEAVDGHCLIVQDEIEMVGALTRIIVDLQTTKLEARRIALSDAPVVERLARSMAVEVDDIAVAPGAAALFGYDVGITMAQAAIAETGTLMLDSAHERHRLVSLLPPVHIAIVEASQVYLTLGEALSVLRRDDNEVSQTVTFVTGPSRTADIELILAIGVHGPQELFVIVNVGPPLKNG